ncbi:MAG: hypothetical protein GY870_13650 [archaeon]|nr:hypothetical protein [archaeon]
MPKGMVIIDWDEFSGAETFFQYPDNFIVDDNNLQQIQISHNFISSIMVHRDDNVNAISYYNEDHGKVIALFLTKLEDGQDYYEFIKQLDDTMVQCKDRLSQEDLFLELIRMFKISFNVYKVNEEVMFKLANEVADMKALEFDYRNRFEELFNFSNNTESSILLSLAIHNKLERKKLIKIIRTKKKKKVSTINRALDKLTEKNQILGYKSYQPTYEIMKLFNDELANSGADIIRFKVRTEKDLKLSNNIETSILYILSFDEKLRKEELYAVIKDEPMNIFTFDNMLKKYEKETLLSDAEKKRRKEFFELLKNEKLSKSNFNSSLKKLANKGLIHKKKIVQINF